MPYLIENPEAPNQAIHELRFGENTIGRERDNTIIVMHGSLSRHHAKVTNTDDRIIIEDLNSLNHTFVNDIKVDQCELQDGDIIRCGSVFFRFLNVLSDSATTPLLDKSSNISIVKSLPLDPSRTSVQDLLEDSSSNQHSVLKLRQQNSDQRALDKLKILLEVSKELSSPEEPDRLLEKILDLLFQIVKVDRGVILLVNETTKQLEQKAAKNRLRMPTDYLFYSTMIPAYVCQHGIAVLANDARTDQRFNTSDSVIAQAIHASMCVPLKPREKVIGVLYVDNLSITNVYSEEDLEFLTALANQAAIAIDNARLYEKMQAEAVIRAKLERFFPESVNRMLREKSNIEIIDTEVTALFSDISSFTEMSSTMEPRQVIEMLNEYFRVMVEDIVFKYEGTLEKYIGDALLAIWGAPYQQPDDADRAIKAAIAMQWELLRLNERWRKQRNLQIQIHIGINTGKVAAGNIGSPKLFQYATVGDTTNVTSRICNAAKAGEILISQSTLDKLSDRTLPLEKIEPVWVKGKDHPLQLYRVLWEQVKPLLMLETD